MKLKKIGFYKELNHGDKSGMSLKESINNSSIKNEEKIIEYLDNGIAVCITAGLVSDALDETKGVIGNLEILTDGVWAWPSDLSYYIKFYHVKLDMDFVEHIKKNKWIVPNDNNIDLLRLEL